jgi:hypothetical protein
MVSEWQQPDVEILRGQIRRAAAQSSALCVVALATGYPMLSRLFSFPELMADRLAFALQADVFVMFWILFGVGLVSRGRRHSPADIGGAISGPPSPRIAIKAAFLQNTLEQAVLIVGMHLALVTLLPRDALSLIVVSVALFAIGRFTFLYGYRKGAGGRAVLYVYNRATHLRGLSSCNRPHHSPAGGGVGQAHDREWTRQHGWSRLICHQWRSNCLKPAAALSLEHIICNSKMGSMRSLIEGELYREK